MRTGVRFWHAESGYNIAGIKRLFFLPDIPSHEKKL